MPLSVTRRRTYSPACGLSPPPSCHRSAAARMDVGDRDPDLADRLTLVADRLCRIDDQVDQRRLELVAVGKARPAGARRLARLLDDQRDLLVDAPNQQAAQSLDDGAHVGRARVEPLAAGEGEQLLDQPVGALRGEARLPNQQSGALAVPEPGRQPLQIALDDGQHVVEVVGDAAGQLADRLHLLGLPQALLAVAQCRLGLPARGHVGDHAERALGPAGLVALQMRRDQHVDHRARRVQELAFELADLAAPDRQSQSLALDLDLRGGDEGGDVATDDLVAPAADQVGHVVARLRHPSVQVERVERRRQADDHLALASLAGAEAALRVLALGDAQRQQAVGLAHRRRRGQGEGARQQPPDQGGGGKRHHRGDRLQHALEPVGGNPERDDAHQVGQSAGEDEGGEEQVDPAEDDVLAADHEACQRQRDAEVGQRDGGVRQRVQPDQAGSPKEAEAVWRQSGRSQQIGQETQGSHPEIITIP